MRTRKISPLAIGNQCRTPRSLSRFGRAWAAFGLVLGLGACLTVEKSLYVRETPPPRTKAADIQMLYEKPKQAHRVLGLLAIRYNKGYDRGKIIDKLKQEAAELGADALLQGDFSTRNDTWNVGSVRDNRSRGDRSDSFTATEYRLTMSMIRFEP